MPSPALGGDHLSHHRCLDDPDEAKKPVCNAMRYMPAGRLRASAPVVCNAMRYKPSRRTGGISADGDERKTRGVDILRTRVWCGCRGEESFGRKFKLRWVRSVAAD